MGVASLNVLSGYLHRVGEEQGEDPQLEQSNSWLNFELGVTRLQISTATAWDMWDGSVSTGYAVQWRIVVNH
jgi:hypothetical protein